MTAERPTRAFAGLRRAAPVLLPLALLVGTGLRGIDFGFHWDEGLHVKGVQNSLVRGVPLPGIYYYPGVSYWLTLASVLPEIVEHTASGDALPVLLAAVSSRSAWLRTRGVFLVASALAVLFVQQAVLAWGRRPGEALLAASVLALSWQYAYHARWIAPDGVLATFTALTGLCLVRALGPGRRAWLWGAAAAAGLACGTKWTAGLLVVPVLAAAVARTRGEPARARAVLGAGLLGVFVGVYLLTTPGTLFEYPVLLRYLELQEWRYATGHQGYTVAAGGEHLAKILEYVTLVFPSHFLPVSLVLSACAGLGVVALARESWRTTLLLLSFPVLYVGYLSLHRVMIARNLLLLGLFYAVLAARGVAWLWERVTPRGARGVLGLGVASLLAANAVWLVIAAETIRWPDARFVEQLVAYVEARPTTRFHASPGVWRTLRVHGAAPPPNLVRGPAVPPDLVLCLASEAQAGGGRDRLPANRRDLTLTWFGPYEVDFDAYPSWEGRDRILLASAAGAVRLGCPLSARGARRGRRPAGRRSAFRPGSDAAGSTR